MKENGGGSQIENSILNYKLNQRVYHQGDEMRDLIFLDLQRLLKMSLEQFYQQNFQIESLIEHLRA
jgi:hypothetical protein